MVKTLAFIFLGFGLIAVLLAPPTAAIINGLVIGVPAPFAVFALITICIVACFWLLL